MSELILPPEPRVKGTFRIYRLRAGELVHFGDTGSAKSAGEWIVRLYDEGEFGVDDCVGLKRERGMDADGNELPGEWIINPFNLGRSRRLLEPRDGQCRAMSKAHGRRCRKRATQGEWCDTHARAVLKARKPW